jgi:hypothetical protein
MWKAQKSNKILLLGSQINALMLHLKPLEKQQQAEPRTSRRRERIKIRPKSTK